MVTPVLWCSMQKEITKQLVSNNPLGDHGKCSPVAKGSCNGFRVCKVYRGWVEGEVRETSSEGRHRNYQSAGGRSRLERLWKPSVAMRCQWQRCEGHGAQRSRSRTLTKQFLQHPWAFLDFAQSQSINRTAHSLNVSLVTNPFTKSAAATGAVLATGNPLLPREMHVPFGELVMIFLEQSA